MAKANVPLHKSKLPPKPIDLLLNPLSRFLHIESVGAIVLFCLAVVALFIANSGSGTAFQAFWHTPLGIHAGAFTISLSLSHWINDGLMTIFFFVMGLEIKREIVLGELRGARSATLPIVGACGGMIVPALFYNFLQPAGIAANGWAIPMATDITFVAGFLALLDQRIPPGLRIFLLSLAIVDDIGAICVKIFIGLVYADHIDVTILAYTALSILAIYGLLKAGLRNVSVYVVLMILVWFGFHKSGIHATITGVIFGLLTPVHPWVDDRRFCRIMDRTNSILSGAGLTPSPKRYQVLREMQKAARKAISPVEYFENSLHPWLTFVIMPLFVLANVGVAFSHSYSNSPVTMAVIISMFIGKPLGVFMACRLAVASKLTDLPSGVNWGTVLGAGFLAGVGFTMALFIADMSLTDPALHAAKIGVLVGSLLSAIVGTVLLLIFLPKTNN